jgi:hypothetical protein
VHTLRGSDRIPHVGGMTVQRTVAGQGEIVVMCPDEDCGWSTIRPAAAAWSAGEAHRIRHARGTL